MMSFFRSFTSLASAGEADNSKSSGAFSFRDRVSLEGGFSASTTGSSKVGFGASITASSEVGFSLGTSTTASVPLTEAFFADSKIGEFWFETSETVAEADALEAAIRVLFRGPPSEIVVELLGLGAAIRELFRAPPSELLELLGFALLGAFFV